MDNLNVTELAAQEDKLLAEREELVDANLQARAADGVMSDEVANASMLRNERVAQIDGSLAHIDRQRKRVEARKPNTPRNKQSALSRAVRALLGGKPPTDGLEAWEAKRFMGRDREADEFVPAGAQLSFHAASR